MEKFLVFDVVVRMVFSSFILFFVLEDEREGNGGEIKKMNKCYRGFMVFFFLVWVKSSRYR